MANGIDARHKEELKYDVYRISRYLYQCYSNNLFWGCLDSAVGRGDGKCSARQCCRGHEFDSRGGP